MLLKMKDRDGHRVYMNTKSEPEIGQSLLRKLVAQMSSVGEMDFVPPGYEGRPITIKLEECYGDQVFITSIKVQD